MIVRPSAPSRWNRSIRCRRWMGSAPLRGSSSTSTTGSFTSAAATLERWRMPLLKPSMDRSATGRSSTVAEGPVDRGAVRDAVEVGHVLAQLARREADAGRPRPRARGPGPSTRSGPCAGRAAEDRHRALVHRQEAGDGPHQRGLARAVRPEEAGDARPERAAQLGQRHLLAEPHRHGRPTTTVGSATKAGSTTRSGAAAAGRGGGEPASPLHLVVADEERRDRGDDHGGVHEHRGEPAVRRRRTARTPSSTWPRKTRSRSTSGSENRSRSAAGWPWYPSTLGVARDRPGHDRGDQEQADDRGARGDPARRERREGRRRAWRSRG